MTILLLQIVLWVALAVIVIAFVEYAVHRWFMHDRRVGGKWSQRVWERHAVLHHGRYFRESFDHDDDPASRHISIDIGGPFMVAGTSWIWIPLLFVSPVGAVVFVAVAAIHGAAWTVMHREMHRPVGRFFSKWWAYRYIRAYHKKHHEQPGRNFNAVFAPIADWFCGTYVKPDMGDE